MNYSIIFYEKSENVGLITLRRPEALNALNSRFFDEMEHLLSEIGSDLNLRCLLITGEGRAFAAGADIAEMAGMLPDQATIFALKGQKVFNMIENFPVPVIAAINGFALGGGCELALSCDIRLASSKAKLGQPEVNLGLIPGYAATQRLPRLIGMGNAMYLLLSAEVINADDALKLGIVQKVYEPEMLLQEAQNLAATIAAKSPAAIRQIKKVIRQGRNFSFTQGSNLEADQFGKLFQTPQMIEGTRAFLEKRNPKWDNE